MNAIFASLRFGVIYAWEVCRGGFRIAWDIFTPDLPTSARIIDVEIPPMGSMHRLLLANLVSMTPGSISIDYREDGALLHIHLLYADTDEATMRSAIHDRFLPLVLSLPETRAS